MQQEITQQEAVQGITIPLQDKADYEIRIGVAKEPDKRVLLLFSAENCKIIDYTKYNEFLNFLKTVESNQEY